MMQFEGGVIARLGRERERGVHNKYSPGQRDSGPRQSVQDEPGGGRAAAAADLRAPQASRTRKCSQSAGGAR